MDVNEQLAKSNESLQRYKQHLEILRDMNSELITENNQLIIEHDQMKTELAKTRSFLIELYNSQERIQSNIRLMVPNEILETINQTQSTLDLTQRQGQPDQCENQCQEQNVTDEAVEKGALIHPDENNGSVSVIDSSNADGQHESNEQHVTSSITSPNVHNEAIASDAHDTQPRKRKMELSDANGGPKKKPSKQTTVIAKDGAGDDNQQLTPRRSARIMVRSLLDIDNSNGNGNDDQANPNKISNRRKTSV